MRDDEFLSEPNADCLILHQRLATSGARAAHLFQLHGERWLAVPQLAEDVAGQPPNMNGGNSDTQAILFRWEDGKFVERDRLPCPGGEDALTFKCDGSTFLAFANLRTGTGPYEANTKSLIYRHVGARWEQSSAIPSFAAKQWHYFEIANRQFLALAQGLTLPHYTPLGHGQSVIFERVQGQWQEFQILDGRWGYNWRSFQIGGDFFLAYADHTSPSLIYRWEGNQFVQHQSFAHSGGRSFLHFSRDGKQWLVFAAIDGTSDLYRWDGNKFQFHQLLGGAGGREFAEFEAQGEFFLVRICFIEGAPAAPKTDLKSQLYRWADQCFELVEEFPTYGGTDAAHFHDNGVHFLVVANGLTKNVRFGQDSAVYRINLQNRAVLSAPATELDL